MLTSAASLPMHLYRDMLRAVASRLDATPEARRCAGLSFAFAASDVPALAVRYVVGGDGRIAVEEGRTVPSTFSFTGRADDFDAVLSGRAHPLAYLLRRRIALAGSLRHLRCLMSMLPVLREAYVDARAALRDRHAARYVFAF